MTRDTDFYPFTIVCLRLLTYNSIMGSFALVWVHMYTCAICCPFFRRGPELCWLLYASKSTSGYLGETKPGDLFGKVPKRSGDCTGARKCLTILLRSWMRAWLVVTSNFPGYRCFHFVCDGNSCLRLFQCTVGAAMCIFLAPFYSCGEMPRLRKIPGRSEWYGRFMCSLPTCSGLHLSGVLRPGICTAMLSQ